MFSAFLISSYLVMGAERELCSCVRSSFVSLCGVDNMLHVQVDIYVFGCLVRCGLMG